MDELVDELSSAMIDVDNNDNNDNNDQINGIHSTSNDKYVNDNNDASMIPIRNTRNHHKPVERTASILIRSKLLILSDSESDEDNINSGINNRMSQLSARKGKKRTNKKLNKLQERIQMQYNSCGYTGKRKRSSTISEGSGSTTHHSATHSHTSGHTQTHTSGHSSHTQMECDNNVVNVMHMQSDSSSISDTSSDECHTDLNCDGDGDDEQSDFYEVIARTSTKINARQRHHNHNSRPIDFPTAPTRNPFLTMGLSPSVGSSYNSTLSSTNMLWKRRRRMH